MKQKVGFISLLKETLKFPFKNTLYTRAIILTSLPFLPLMIYIELLFEKISAKTWKFPTSVSIDSQSYWWPVKHLLAFLKGQNSYEDEFIILRFLPLIFLFIFHVLDFLLAFCIIDFSSKIHKDDPNKSEITISLKDMILKQSIISSKERLKGTFLTCLYVLFISTTLSFGLFQLFSCYYLSYAINFFYLIFTAVFVPAFIVLFPKYLELNAICNLSLVISVLEKVHGLNAIGLSFHLSKGNERLGKILILPFLVSGFSLRLYCTTFDDGVIGVTVRTSLLWLASMVKWVLFVMYFYHCKDNKALVLTIDEEVGHMVACADGLNENNCPPNDAKLVKSKVLDEDFEKIGATDTNISYSTSTDITDEVSNTQELQVAELSDANTQQ